LTINPPRGITPRLFEEDLMKRSPRPRRVPGNLSKSVLRRLDFYALAASAAGVGMTVQPADAKIIYTPTHVLIVGIVSVDLNHDSSKYNAFVVVERLM
jgi:hypothetical protein